MTNKEILIKQIIYRSTHRGSKEMDILLGNFVKKFINEFNENDLKDLDSLLLIEDEILSNWYFHNSSEIKIPVNKISTMLKGFKI